jgi:hypothetical protein
MYRLYKPEIEVIDKYIQSKGLEVNTTNRLICAYRMYPIPFYNEDRENTGEILFSYEIIARIANQETEAQAKNFRTKETRKLYRRLFPNDGIILQL